jgi:hypothetical protein
MGKKIGPESEEARTLPANKMASPHPTTVSACLFWLISER